jgi:hypothetical protein
VEYLSGEISVTVIRSVMLYEQMLGNEV